MMKLRSKKGTGVRPDQAFVFLGKSPASIFYMGEDGEIFKLEASGFRAGKMHLSATPYLEARCLPDGTEVQLINLAVYGDDYILVFVPEDRRHERGLVDQYVIA